MYHADPCEQPSLSASIASILINKSPRHAKHAHPRLNPDHVREESTKFDIGNVVHALILEGNDIVQVCDFPDWRTNAAKDARAEARAAGRIPLLTHELANVFEMVSAATEQLTSLDLSPRPFTNGDPEVCLIWEEGGVQCRALVDWLSADGTLIDDFKSTGRSANPASWTRSTLYTIGADIQTAFYLRGLRALGAAAPLMRYVVQETYAPYALSVIDLGPDVLAVADQKVDEAIELWRACLAADRWPSYATQVATAKLPPWVESQWLESQGREEVTA
jgi:hypothetical protein